MFVCGGLWINYLLSIDIGVTSTIMTPREKSIADRVAAIIAAYKREGNIGEVSRQHGISRQRIHQILTREKVTIKKRGNQGARDLSTGTR